MRLVKILLVLVLLVLGWIVGWSNNADTTLAFLDAQTPSFPLFVWLFLSIFVGFIIGLLASRLFR
ncbi:LapA family protein [Reinekea forsetii]|nr:LapA family protein [Reinekea forsetii]